MQALLALEHIEQDEELTYEVANICSQPHNLIFII